MWRWKKNMDSMMMVRFIINIILCNVNILSLINGSIKISIMPTMMNMKMMIKMTSVFRMLAIIIIRTYLIIIIMANREYMMKYILMIPYIALRLLAIIGTFEISAIVLSITWDDVLKA